MSHAKIINGAWKRNVTWKHGTEWRTDIFKSVLSDSRLRECCFVLEGGPTVVIPAAELRRVVEHGKERYDGKIWGPFNIDPMRSAVNGHEVQMQIISGL